jgi:hypothetical protein
MLHHFAVAAVRSYRIACHLAEAVGNFGGTSVRWRAADH